MSQNHLCKKLSHKNNYNNQKWLTCLCFIKICPYLFIISLIFPGFISFLLILCCGFHTKLLQISTTPSHVLRIFFVICIFCKMNQTYKLLLLIFFHIFHGSFLDLMKSKENSLKHTCRRVKDVPKLILKETVMHTHFNTRKSVLWAAVISL